MAKVKTNTGLAEMIMKFIANEDGQSEADGLTELRDEAQKVLAAEDRPDDHSRDCPGVGDNRHSFVHPMPRSAYDMACLVLGWADNSDVPAQPMIDAARKVSDHFDSCVDDPVGGLVTQMLDGSKDVRIDILESKVKKLLGALVIAQSYLQDHVDSGYDVTQNDVDNLACVRKTIKEAKEGAAVPDGEAVVVAPDGKAGILDAMCEQIEGLKREVGNMGVALGLVEGQRDDLLKNMEWIEELQRENCCCEGLENHPGEYPGCVACIAKEAIAKRKAGQGDPPVLVRAPGGDSNDYILHGNDSVWVEVRDLVLHIIPHDECLTATIYEKLDVEMPLSTAKATFGYETQGQDGSDAPKDDG